MPEIACGESPGAHGCSVGVGEDTPLDFAPPARGVQEVEAFLAGLRGERPPGSFDAALRAAEGVAARTRGPLPAPVALLAKLVGRNCPEKFAAAPQLQQAFSEDDA